MATQAGMTASRREALMGGAGLILSLMLPLGSARAQKYRGTAKTIGTVDPNAYIRIGEDNVITVVIKHIEWGQGIYTGLATLVAEELDADWSQIRAESAPVNPALYGNSIFGGVQVTAGSSAMPSSHELMRRAGATGRAMLVRAAADRWGVRPEEIQVSKGLISHARSGRHGRFGEFAGAAAKLPLPQDVKLKDPAAFTLIGRDRLKRLDTPGKVNGSAIYTIDIHEPDMLTVVVARPPRFGAKPGTVDAAEALKIQGVVAVKPISSGFAVYAKGMWPALKGRDALHVTWDESAAEKRSSEDLIKEYLELTKTAGVSVNVKGNAGVAPAKDGELVEATYIFPYLAHAPMEPLDGYIRWDGASARARYGCQAQTFDQAVMADILGLTPDKVSIETMMAGGGFGRRAPPNMHFAAEMAECAKAIGTGKAIKLVWTREDDIKGGLYRPLFVHRLRGVVKDGKIVAWWNSLAGQSFFSGTAIEEGFAKVGYDADMVRGSDQLLYDINNFSCSVHKTLSPITTSPWRSTSHGHTVYAVECFIDTLLEKCGKDPVAGRLELLAKEPRATGVLKAVAKLADWKGPAPVNGRARGVALVEAYREYGPVFVAQIVEVSLDESGEPKVHKVWCAIDCGLAVNPDNIRAQMEGGIGWGVGHSLFSDIPIEAGATKVSNFFDYRVLKMKEMPDVEVVIVPSPEPPSGIGELGVPAVGPAIANALARLTGTRPSRLPMVRPS